jgi:UDP-N-acetylglucosamine transferase subunit ALG13
LDVCHHVVTFRGQGARVMKSYPTATCDENPLARTIPSPTATRFDARLVTRDTRRALFAVSSLGLGHATRTLVVIRDYLNRGYAITVVSSGNALAFLRLELSEKPGVEFREMPDYPPLERGTGWRLYWYLFIDLLHTWRLIRNEHREVQAIAGDYDFIFSDGRYGFYSRWTPSFILSHQIAFVPPKGLRETSWLTETVNVAALRKFDMLFIPDYFGPSLNLAGHLAHTPALHRCRHRYVGILSSYRHLGLEQDIDCLFIISGYLLEHKESFVRDLLEQASRLPGKKVFVLGDANGDESVYDRYRRDDLQIYAMASGDLRQDLFNRARVIVSRAGYTTVMDLAEHGKRALLIPTPNQTEQEYLASYLGSQYYYVSCMQQSGIDLGAALQASEQTRLFEPPWKTDESLRRITDEIEELMHRHFISIIVPAYNEESEIEATLQCLLGQRYPWDRYEIIVVENCSTDATLGIANRVAKQAGDSRIRIVSINDGGVSHAKNVGLDNVAPESEWVVFCDADTRLGQHLLQHLNTWLNRRGENGLSVGTTSVRPESENGWYARAWFSAYDCIHRLTRTSFSIQVARTQVARGVRFREDLSFAEDLMFIQECRRYGRFFFVPTDQVSTSTRRFDSYGYLRLGLRWTFQALLPLRLKVNRKYDVIR